MPRQYGGAEQAPDPLKATIIAEEFRRARAPFEIMGQGPSMLVPTLLEHGTEIARARPPRVQAIDGTGAGDAFTACLVVSLLEGRDRQEALRRACAAGAIAASQRGAQPSLPSAAQVEALLGAY